MIDVDSINSFQLLCGDCLDVMNYIPDQTIDMIFADLPYGTTQNVWDKLLELEDYIIFDNYKFNKAEFLLYAYQMGQTYKEAVEFWKFNKNYGLWSHYKRIIKDNGCIALFCQTPFDVKLAKSNLKMLKYEWVVEKTNATGFFNSKKAPLKAHEKVLIFYKKPPVYNPQMTDGHSPVHNFVKRTGDGNCYGEGKEVCGGGSTKRFPRDVLKYKWDKQQSNLHNTQKPLALLEYFVKTYTNKDDIVLDNCMGSGGTGVACINTGRRFLGIELNSDIFAIAQSRIDQNNHKGVSYEQRR